MRKLVKGASYAADNRARVGLLIAPHIYDMITVWFLINVMLKYHCNIEIWRQSVYVSDVE